YEKIVLDDGERWLGVFAPSGGASAVRECVVHVAGAPNPVQDVEPRRVRRVSAVPGDGLVFLVKGNPRVKPGRAVAVLAPGHEPSDRVELTLGKTRWTLERVEEETKAGPLQRLYAAADGKRALLAETGTRDSIVPVWA